MSQVIFSALCCFSRMECVHITKVSLLLSVALLGYYYLATSPSGAIANNSDQIDSLQGGISTSPGTEGGSNTGNGMSLFSDMRFGVPESARRLRSHENQRHQSISDAKRAIHRRQLKDKTAVTEMLFEEMSSTKAPKNPYKESKSPKSEKSEEPTFSPSQAPSESALPSFLPSDLPSESLVPSMEPTSSMMPSMEPTSSMKPSMEPTESRSPSTVPSGMPSYSANPSMTPSYAPFNEVLSLLDIPGTCGSDWVAASAAIEYAICFDIRDFGGRAPFVIDTVTLREPSDLSTGLLFLRILGGTSSVTPDNSNVLYVQSFPFPRRETAVVRLDQPVTVTINQVCVGIEDPSETSTFSEYAMRANPGSGTRSFVRQSTRPARYKSLASLGLAFDLCIEASASG